MDHFEGVVLDYLRADRALFVNSQCCIQLNEGANPDTSGPHWYCDAVAVSFKEQATYAAEIHQRAGRGNDGPGPGRGSLAQAQLLAIGCRTYLTNHCQACDALQGDHFVYGPDGPFFPQDRAGVDQLKVIPGHGAVMASASTAQSGWIAWIAIRLHGGQ
ncbi:hypothetical protein [Xanthomonas campestris]|uniref:Uncharacterized protein n=1 Tax=Xanthomonas campestris pv. papavericola TaxID=487881 RepID=A0AAJ2X523_XANCA|nr:hypothetical protein [Xanthomonas campestris]MEC3888913.1 hypothetical protein [Xanthomonas campestris pv. papavericola]